MSDTQKLLIEAVGTFVFLSVIFHSLDNPLIGALGVSAALLTAIHLGADISGAHYNPAVTFAMFVDNKIPMYLGLSYVAAQLIGAYAAYMFNKEVLKKNASI
jgi:glycerol uptake facilitator-like aquaporin